MTPFPEQLAWIVTQSDQMRRLVTDWAGINSGSRNLAGLTRMLEQLKTAFAPLADELEVLDLPPQRVVDPAGQVVPVALGQALLIRRRPQAPQRVFLGIHMDTVFGSDHPFQAVSEDEPGILRGPGVADAKGGLAVMLIALEALERSGLADRIGWDVLINPDEELSSPGSGPLFAECAGRCRIGLVFEPALPDGTLIGQRKGSGNFTLVVRGRAAHAGREFHAGRNALHAAADAITQLDRLNDPGGGITFNTGRIDGGGPVNVVADLAVMRFNVRVVTPQEQQRVERELQRVLADLNAREGISAELHGQFGTPPKPLNEPTQRLLEHIAECGRQLGLQIGWRPSGGVCDGNRLAAAGLPTVDTMGPRGGDIHSDREYLILDSLTERAKLTAMVLMKFAGGEL
jgi:glutamate carboxypeptidase